MSSKSPGPVRAAAYAWTLPNTLLGLPIAALGLLPGGGVRRVDGVIEAHGPAISWLLRHCTPLAKGASALALGHVVLGQDADSLDNSRTHERVHVRQYEQWGVAFLPAYGLASLVALLRGGDPYRDNRFELEAYRREAEELS